MKILNLIYTGIICIILTQNSYGQSRCDTTSGTIAYLLENIPECNVSIDDLEIKINNTFNPRDYDIPNDLKFYIHFIINCKGEDFEYRVYNLENETFNKQLIDLIQGETKWSSLTSNNRPIDIGYSYTIIVEKEEFNLLNTKGRERKL